MKRSWRISLWYIVVAFVLMVGPYTFAKVCDASEMKMKCYWSVRAELGIAILYLVEAFLIYMVTTWEAKIVLGIINIATSIIAISIPLILIGGCSNHSMACQSRTFPTIYLFTGISILVSIIFIFIISKKWKNTRREE